MSKNKYILNDSVFFETKNAINEHLNNYLTNVIKLQKNISHKILNSWVMKHEKNNFSHRHFHQNSLISGILYIQTDENSGVEPITCLHLTISNANAPSVSEYELYVNQQITGSLKNISPGSTFDIIGINA